MLEHTKVICAKSFILMTHSFYYNDIYDNVMFNITDHYHFTNANFACSCIYHHHLVVTVSKFVIVAILYLVCLHPMSLFPHDCYLYCPLAVYLICFVKPVRFLFWSKLIQVFHIITPTSLL